MSLREQFESEFDKDGVELLFETRISEYVKWLENKLNKVSSTSIVSKELVISCDTCRHDTNLPFTTPCDRCFGNNSKWEKKI